MIIGCNEGGNNIGFLKKDLKIVNPYIYNDNNKLVTNFDYLLLFDMLPEHSEYSDIIRLYKNDLKIIGTFREKKCNQMKILSDNGFNVPKYYNILFDFDNNINRQDIYFSLLKDCDGEFILKDNCGARGIGQVLLKTKDDLYNLLSDVFDKKDIEYLSSNYSIGGEISATDEYEKKYIIDTIKNSNFFITERVKLKVEYRILAFYPNTFIIVERSIDNTWQANISITNKYKLINNNNFNSDVLIKIESFLKVLKTPWLSMDFYIDENDNYGCFEYQMQYGYKSIPKKEMIINSVKSVKTLIKDSYEF